MRIGSSAIIFGMVSIVFCCGNLLADVQESTPERRRAVRQQGADPSRFRRVTPSEEEQARRQAHLQEQREHGNAHRLEMREFRQEFMKAFREEEDPRAALNMLREHRIEEFNRRNAFRDEQMQRRIDYSTQHLQAETDEEREQKEQQIAQMVAGIREAQDKRRQLFEEWVANLDALLEEETFSRDEVRRAAQDPMFRHQRPE